MCGQLVVLLGRATGVVAVVLCRSRLGLLAALVLEGGVCRRWTACVAG